MIKIYRYVFDLLDSNMYVLIEGNDAIIIDPHYNEDALKLLLHYSIKDVDIILTHEHFDHVSGVMRYSEFVTNVIASNECKIILENPDNRINSRFAATFIGVSDEKRKRIKEVCEKKVVVQINKGFDDEMNYKWHEHNLYLRSTPGHTPGSICVILDDKYLFTGDSLIPGQEVVTRFPGGNKDIYDKVTKKYLESLNKNLIVYPGHGDIGELGELL